MHNIGIKAFRSAYQTLYWAFRVLHRWTKLFVSRFILNKKSRTYYVWEFSPVGGLAPDVFIDVVNQLMAPFNQIDFIVLENTKRREFYVLTGFPHGATGQIFEQVMKGAVGVTRNYFLTPETLLHAAISGSYRLHNNPSPEKVRLMYEKFCSKLLKQYPLAEEMMKETVPAKYPAH